MLHPHNHKIFKDPNLFSKYLFDICYGAHILHCRAGIIHGDLHLNNITLYQLDIGKKNNLVMYLGPNGQKDTYIFENLGSYMCLIDYSRSLLGLHSPCFKGFTDIEMFKYLREQRKRALHRLYLYIPTIVQKSQSLIAGLMQSHWERMFYVVACIDFLAIGRNFLHFFESNQNELKIHDDILKQTRDLYKIASSTMSTAIQDALNEKFSSVWPGDKIIPVLFAKHHYENWNLADIKNKDITYWNANGEYKEISEKIPDWLKYEYFKAHLSTRNNLAFNLVSGEDRLKHLGTMRDEMMVGLDGPGENTSTWIN
jgi:hypothetical protein